MYQQDATFLEKEFYSKVAQDYDNLFFAWQKNYLLESQQLHALIQENKQAFGNKLLDVGCGTSEHLRYLQENYEVCGIDLSREMIKLSQKKLPNTEFFEANMIDFDLSRKFDVIISLFSAIGYVKTVSRLHKTIKNICRHLNPGGVVIIEPWFTPEEICTHLNDVQFGQYNQISACRMRKTIVENTIATVTTHILISSQSDVKYISNDHKFGLFSRQDFFSAFDASQLQAHFIEGGITERGVYVATKPI
jgi:SAM-dependent methyltransferase